MSKIVKVFWIYIWAFSVQHCIAFGDSLVVPESYEIREGEGGAFIFTGAGNRDQIVYNAVHFLNAMPAGALISGIALRLDGGAGLPLNGDSTTIEVRLSTTSSMAPSFPLNWAANIGRNETIVFPR